MSPMNNNNLKDYQTVLEEQTPLVSNDAVKNKSPSTRLATLLGIGIAIFVFLAMSGQYIYNGFSELKAVLADHQSQLQALTVESTPLWGAALQGSIAVGDLCVADSECSSGACNTKPYAFCAAALNSPNGAWCAKGRDCASGYCTSSSNRCRPVLGPGEQCSEPKGCISGKCSPLSYFSFLCE